MAIAVESSDVILCFLTKKYQLSANCQLELRYALHLQKPIIFILSDLKECDALRWIQEAIKATPRTYVIRSIADCGADEGGVPRINRICEEIRDRRKLHMQSAKGRRVYGYTSPEVRIEQERYL
tara:strand:+ start:280 stop:651 length:372 start_codon:yes stop_codon:yes gene_type:complete